MNEFHQSIEKQYYSEISRVSWAISPTKEHHEEFISWLMTGVDDTLIDKGFSRQLIVEESNILVDFQYVIENHGDLEHGRAEDNSVYY